MMHSKNTSESESQQSQASQPRRSGPSRLQWEKPLGTIRGYLDEPGPRFVDVEGEAELEAMRWERGNEQNGTVRT